MDLRSLLDSLRTLDPRILEQEYNMVRSQSLALKRDLSSEAGALKENVKKNRYKDILPYDQSRVVLSLPTTDSDYINASFLKGAASSGCSYIAAQAPLSCTITDFWTMIWQHDIKVIVMACREIEMGKRKCECYWAPVHQSAAFGPFTVCNQVETRPNEDMVVRNLSVTYRQETRRVTHFQFLSWPDHDIPYEAEGVLDLLQKARNTQGTHSSPLLVHCSAGCGRTGVICALDYIHDLLVTTQITADFSIMNIVLELRRQRPSAVQTKEQYGFIFRAVACMLERFLQQEEAEPQRKNPEKATRTTSLITDRSFKQPNMNDTYAVVNKQRGPAPPARSSAPSSTDSTYSSVLPRSSSSSSSRSLPPSHHYDNDGGGASAPLYSAVRPRSKVNSLQPLATPLYDLATNHRPGEEPLAADHSSADDDYEEFSSSVTDNVCSHDGIGFNCRIQKPRGPRDPPAEWSRQER